MSFGEYSLFSQTVNGKLLTAIDTQYLRVSYYTADLFNGTIYIKIDYGQELKLRNSSYLFDANGKKMQFYSFVDASNFLFKCGFDYYDVTTIRNENVNFDTFIYIFKKKSDH